MFIKESLDSNLTKRVVGKHTDGVSSDCEFSHDRPIVRNESRERGILRRDVADTFLRVELRITQNTIPIFSAGVLLRRVMGYHFRGGEFIEH